VRDDNRGAVPHQPIKRLLHQPFAFIVQRAWAELQDNLKYIGVVE